MKYIQGDLLKAFENKEVDCILHSCNLTIGMGAGIAKAIAEKYPMIVEYDKFIRNKATYTPESLLGIPFGKDGIYNLYIQYFSGGSKEGFDTTKQRFYWLSKALTQINKLEKGKTVGIPLLLSGLAKDKSKPYTSDLNYFQNYIEVMVKDHLTDCTPVIYYL